MHKKVHGSDKYRCLAISYSILSGFKETFRIILPSFLPHDQYARGVVVCCEGAVSHVASLLAGQFTYLVACLVSWLVGSLVSQFLTCLVSWFLGWLLGCLVGYLLTHLHGFQLARSLSPSLARLLACFFVLLCLLMFIYLAQLSCEGCAVEHQKLSQTTAFG